MAKEDNKTPLELGFTVPAEWEKHKATWLGWPHNKNDWPGKFEPIPWVFGEIARNIAAGEKVKLLVENNKHAESAKQILKDVHCNMKNIEFHQLNTNRGWTRDIAPAFIKNQQGKNAAVHFQFNAWAKYDNFKKDAKFPEYLAQKEKIKMFTAELNGKKVVLEGGGIDINGKGTLLTTEECFLDPKVQVRNPGFSKKDYEEVFKNYLGITNVLWLGKGITGDDTHGHVDDLCRFINSKTLLLVEENNPKDKNYKNLNENKERIQDFKLQDGSKPEVIYLPMPRPLMFQGERLPASYANFYFCNSAVIVPTFNDPNDRVALGIIKELIKDREVIGIHAVDLVWGFGTLHCLTHEQPL